MPSLDEHTLTAEELEKYAYTASTIRRNFVQKAHNIEQLIDKDDIFIEGLNDDVDEKAPKDIPLKERYPVKERYIDYDEKDFPKGRYKKKRYGELTI